MCGITFDASFKADYRPVKLRPPRIKREFCGTIRE